jgi:hypothetical protein
MVAMEKVMEPTSSFTSRGQPAAGGRPASAIMHNWPSAIIIFGLALVLAWSCLLGYGLVKIIALAV